MVSDSLKLILINCNSFIYRNNRMIQTDGILIFIMCHSFGESATVGLDQEALGITNAYRRCGDISIVAERVAVEIYFNRPLFYTSHVTKYFNTRD